jgi:hypothetical protein
MKNMRKALTKELPSCEPSPTPGCNKRGAAEKHEAGTFRTQINKIKLQSIRKNE